MGSFTRDSSKMINQMEKVSFLELRSSFKVYGARVSWSKKIDSIKAVLYHIFEFERLRRIVCSSFRS